jgi:folate-binding protein YgfZ
MNAPDPVIVPVLEAAAAVRLSDWGVIRARGDDAATFLHGQLTQDTQSLAVGEARLAGYCSPKGRLLASFVLWRTAPDEILLACSADLLAPTLKRLSMFVLRAKCRLSDASGEVALWGVAAPLSADLPVAVSDIDVPARPFETRARADATLVRLPDAAGCARLLLATPAAVAAPALPACPQPVWDWLEVQAAIPRIVARTVDAFVPQMVNLELVGGVHFQKGCYPGQEIVARSQYRGTVKRRMYLVEGEVAAAPGLEVWAAGDASQPAGVVVLAATLQGPAAPLPRHAALVEAKRAQAETGELRLGTADGAPLHRRALPYDLPDAEG